MARKGKGRGRRKRYLKGAVDENLLLTTLGPKDVVSQIFGSVVNERTLVSSLVGTWSLSDFTSGDDIGPVLVGVAHSDYTAAEIEEFIEIADSWNEGNLVAQETARRKIRKIGIFEDQDAGSATADSVLNDGKPITTKLNWIMLQAQSLQIWAYNLGDGAIATTIPEVNLQGHANLWPQ